MKKMDFSKLVVLSILFVTCVTTVLGFLLAFYCVHKGFTSTLPWIATTMTAAWAAVTASSSFYYNMTKSDHSEGGITFEAAKASGFTTSDETGTTDSPAI